MTTRKTKGWEFGSFRSADRTTSKLRRQERALERAAARRRKADLKRQNKQMQADAKRRRRQEAAWKKAALRRRRADDRRIRIERRKFEKQQKRQTLGGGQWGSGGRTGQSASALRAAHNLLALGSAIGARFTKDDREQLLAYANQEMANTGEDLYTVYKQLTELTFVGRLVTGIVEQYDVAGTENEPDTDQSVEQRVLSRVTVASELLGDWERTKSVQNSVALGVAIQSTLGATPDAIKQDQRDIERYQTNIIKDQILDTYVGKSKVWMFFHYLAHPEDRPENAQARALAEVDDQIRSADATQARLAEAAAGAGESVTVQNDGIIDRLRGLIGI